MILNKVRCHEPISDYYRITPPNRSDHQRQRMDHHVADFRHSFGQHHHDVFMGFRQENPNEQIQFLQSVYYFHFFNVLLRLAICVQLRLVCHHNSSHTFLRPSTSKTAVSLQKTFWMVVIFITMVFILRNIEMTT